MNVFFQARQHIEDGDNAGARKECNKWQCWNIGALAWAITITTVVVLAVTFAITFSAIYRGGNTQGRD
jgi:hypothetical protein